MTRSELETKLFYYTMWWRVFYGTLKTIFGLALFKVIDVPFLDLLHILLKKEFIEDPHDILLNFTDSFLQAHPFSVTTFLAYYLIFWGLIDIILSVSLLRGKIWAFPVSLSLIGFFILYEIYRLFHTHSLTLLSVISINVLMFWLIWREYKKEQKPIYSI